MSECQLHIAIPLMDEWENIHTLVHQIEEQTLSNCLVWMCVNQPDEWHYVPTQESVIEQNRKTLGYLNSLPGHKYRILDYSSPGKGWKGKHHGVGMARKVLMDAINEEADERAIILSLDGDTHFDKHYFESIVENFNLHPNIPAISVPYYHRLSEDEVASRAILRYEIYMRHYQWQMQRIESPYAFTALGSAMACRVEAYRRIGGMTPKKSGEDFYFLQKLVKYKSIQLWNPEWVYPAARFSDRVYFGTGPAMIKGAQGDWSSYPIYLSTFFDEIKQSIEQFAALFDQNLDLPIDLVLEPHWADKLRANAKSKEVFVKACHDKFDGLRSLQFLKLKQNQYSFGDEQNLEQFAHDYFPDTLAKIIPRNFSFDTLDLDKLDAIREFFVQEFRCTYDNY
jgi:hypothetical protein